MKDFRHYMLIRCIFFLFILRGGIVVVAQPKSFLFERYLPNYNVSLLTAKDGLSQGSVYFMYRDSRDFMWFSTYEGLNRFDGKQFKQYLPLKNDNESIVGNTIYGITEDKLGNLWVGTEDRLNCLHRLTDKFTNVPSPRNAPQQVHPFYGDSSHIWYIGSNEGLVCYDFKKKQKEILNKDIKVRNDFFQVFSVQRAPNGDIWIPSSNDRTGISRYNSQTKQVDYFFSNHKNNVFGKPMSFFAFRFDDTEGVLWLGTKEGLVRFDVQNKSIEIIKCPFIDFSTNFIYSIIKDRNGTIWLASEGQGLILFHPQTKTFQRFQEESTFSNRLNRYLPSSIFYDQSKDIIWVNLEPIGIMKISNSRWQFKSYQNDPSRVNSLSYNSVRCFTTDVQGHIWMGTLDGGINIFDPKTESFQRINTDTKTPSGLPHNNILKLFRDSKNKIWVGTVSGLALFDVQKQKFQSFLNKPKDIDAINANTVRDILELPDGLLFLATEGGCFTFNPTTQQFSPRVILPNEVVFHLTFDKSQQRLFVGLADKGLYSFRYQNGQFTPLTAILDGYTVTCTYQKNAKLWLATNKGLVEIDEQKHDTLIYAKREGLPSQCLYNMLADSKGNLWLSSNHGLSRFNIADKTFFNFTPQQGLQGFEYNGQAYMKTESGEFYFGGVEGFDRFFPDSIVEKTYAFSTRITDLKINNAPFESDTVVSERHKINLKYNQNTLQIAFQALDYYGNGNNKYRFKLMPFQNEWLYSDINSVNYAQLPPGDYTFVVESATETGVWANENAQLAIHIAPPFWATWWFRLGVLAIVVGTTFYFLQREKKKTFDALQKEQSFQRRIAETEMAALRSQMNPHFIFNVLNSINDYMLNHDARQASQYLTDFSKLIRLVLENSRSEKVSLAHELSALELYMKFEQLRFENKLRYIIELDPKIDVQFTKIPPLLIQPYIENAIWHGLMHRLEGGNVMLRIKQEDENLLHIEIEDDGIGRAAAAELKSKSAIRKKSYGMTITSERIQLVNEIFKTNTQVAIQDLVDTEGVACGTKVVIKIPC